MDKQLLKGFIQPGKVFGNIYFVGLHDASTHIIDTGAGLIMIDPGFPETLWVVLDNMKELGFDEKDIKIILHSHGHYDHAGGTRELVKLTGAKTYIGKDDLKMVNGEEDTSLSKDLTYRFHHTFEPDVLLSDGDVVTLGNTSILCLSTPGHSAGTMSFFFDVVENGNTYRAGMHGGVGINSLTKNFLKKWNMPLSNQDKFIEGLKYAKTQKVEIFLGNHVGNNDTEGKLLRVANGEWDAFYAPEEWNAFIDQKIDEMYRIINADTVNVIILAGMPASGKTTISSKISEAFGYPILEKDEIKEELFDTVGFKNHDEKQQIDTVATAILLHTMDLLLQSGTSLICVNNFRTGDKPQLVELLSKHNCRCVTVFLGGDSDIFYKRYVNRDLTHSRHLGHAMHDHYPPREGEKPDETPLTREQFTEKYEKQGMADFRIDGPRIDVDATFPDKINIKNLILSIRESLH